ncbi:MAG: peptide chain release factor 1 [Bdellovibrionaceae bacterium]|nr:peptide chain release factor 1 [Pseudobdellovibrionaceae bacterium]
MFDRLVAVENRYEQVQHDLQNPSVASDQTRYRSLMKESADLTPVVTLYRRFRKLRADRDGTKEMLLSENDESLREMAKQELSELEAELATVEAELKIALLPKDPNDDKNVILEVRPAAGGDEAALFTDELFRAYALYAAQNGWKVDIMSRVEGNVGGAKEVIASIEGDKVFSKLKHESGVHRVQRVPKTETQGRVHTSTVTVAVLPEAEEIDVKINPNDLKIDVYRSSGAGGQSVNTTDSAVRITHLPTGTIVTCQDERSQLKNKAKAMKILYSRIKAVEDEKAVKTASEARLAQIGTGDRSERIRTYNFPQSRVTDHRIGLTIHSLDGVMKGEMDNLIEPLITYHQAELLQAQSKQD